MCVMVYLASDRPLPEIGWDERSPAFNVTRLDPSKEPVCDQFSKPFVYHLGAHEGCGCGFKYETLDDLRQMWQKEQDLNEAVEENEQGRENVRRLHDYVAAALENGPLEMYALWAGGEEKEPTQRAEIGHSFFTGDRFYFDVWKERRFFVVK